MNCLFINHITTDSHIMSVMKYTFNDVTFTRTEYRWSLFSQSRQNFGCSFSFTVQLQGRVLTGHRYTFGSAWWTNYAKTHFRHSLNQSQTGCIVIYDPKGGARAHITAADDEKRHSRFKTRISRQEGHSNGHLQMDGKEHVWFPQINLNFY